LSPEAVLPPLLRSYLYAPGSSPRLMDKALDAGADAIIYDLEDAVAPREKTAARDTVAAMISGPAVSARCEVHVRVNRAGDGYDLDDVRAVVAPGLRGLRLPKAEDAEAVRAVADLLDELEGAAGMEPGTVALYPIVESAAGVWAAESLARAPRIARLAFGATDFLADIGGRGEGHGEATLHARSHLVLASRVAGVGRPVDSVHTRLDDEDGLRASAERARNLGFFGKSVIHPAQIAVIHDVFTPTEEEVAAAQRLVDAAEAAAAEGRAAIAVGGEFVDPAVVARARAVLGLAEAAARRRAREQFAADMAADLPAEDPDV
jgi:citrate lyase subunit beta / citryl-CoA lyase